MTKTRELELLLTQACDETMEIAGPYENWDGTVLEPMTRTECRLQAENFRDLVLNDGPLADGAWIMWKAWSVEARYRRDR